MFDDLWFLERTVDPGLGAVFRPRGLPNAWIDLTRGLAGGELAWLRLENLALHVANAFLLFLFLRGLYATVTSGNTLENCTRIRACGRDGLPSREIAFAAALLFLLHPVAVYGVAYLVQRSILMATTFALLSSLFFLKAMTAQSRVWLLVSALAYFFSVFSKEHAIMVPAVWLALFVLLRKDGRPSIGWIAPVVVLCGAIATAVLLRYQPGIVGNVYEANAAPLSRSGGSDQTYLLSALTQCYLYFKYLFLWLVPVTSMMSVDMREPLAGGLWTWPQTAGAAGFMLYPVAAGYLLSRKGRVGLAGFGLLCPWMLFATEFSTVRLQEIFVLYRSYLWMPCIGAAFPFLFRNLPARGAVALLAAAAVLVAFLAWNRLATFSEPLLLWDDALKLELKKPSPSGLGRMYHNRGVAYRDLARYEEAIRDFDQGIRHLPRHSFLYNDRAVAYLHLGRYQEALTDFGKAIRFNPNYYNPYLGRAKVFEALGDLGAARRDYARSCQLGVTEACGDR